MASIARRDDGRWRARYRDAAGREHAKHFDRKIDASNWLSVEQSKILRGEWVDPAQGKVTFRVYAEQWRGAQAQHRPSSKAHIETMLRRWAYPTLGDRALVSIQASDIRAWVKTISSSLAPSTVKVVHGVVASVFLAAVDDRRIASSPCQRRARSGKGYLPTIEPVRIEPMTTEQVQGMAAAVSERYRALIVLCAGTGLRQGEAIGLTVDRVDFLRRTLTVDRQLVHLPGAEPAFGPPKTQASYRTVPLPQVVVDVLAAHVARYPITHEAGLLFTTAAGAPIRRSHLSSAVWKPAAKTAQLAAGVTFHDLRHYYASLLIRHGESVKVVQSRLGHATAAETLDTYSHLWPDSDDRTRQAVDEILGSSLLLMEAT